MQFEAAHRCQRQGPEHHRQKRRQPFLPAQESGKRQSQVTQAKNLAKARKRPCHDSRRSTGVTRTQIKSTRAMTYRVGCELKWRMRSGACAAGTPVRAHKPPPTANIATDSDVTSTPHSAPPVATFETHVISFAYLPACFSITTAICCFCFACPNVELHFVIIQIVVFDNASGLAVISFCNQSCDFRACARFECRCEVCLRFMYQSTISASDYIAEQFSA